MCCTQMQAQEGVDPETAVKKPPRRQKKRKLQTDIYFIDAKIINEIVANQFQQCIKRITNMTKWDLSYEGKVVQH